MNFDHTPELRWALGYPFTLTLMIGACLVLYLVFERRAWL